VADGGEEAGFRLMGGDSLVFLQRNGIADRHFTGDVEQLGIDVGELPLRAARSRHVHAHVHELGLVDADQRPVETQVDDDGICPLAQFVQRLDEGDAVRDMHLLGETATQGGAQEGKEHVALAAAGFADIAGTVETEHEAGAEVEGRPILDVHADRRGVRRGGATECNEGHGADEEERDDDGKAERQREGRTVMEGKPDRKLPQA